MAAFIMRRNGSGGCRYIYEGLRREGIGAESGKINAETTVAQLLTETLAVRVFEGSSASLYRRSTAFLERIRLLLPCARDVAKEGGI